MLEKIKNPNPWLAAVILALGVQLLFMLISELMNISTFNNWFRNMGYIFAMPSFNLVAHDTIYFIHEFRGEAVPTDYFSKNTLISGLGVFVIFILGPFLLVKGYVHADKSENSKKRSWTWYAGAVLVITSLVPVFTASTIGTRVYLNTNKSIADNRDKDQLRSALMNLALDASYMVHLPQEKGGGDGSFTNFITEDGQIDTIKLEHLESFNPSDPFQLVLHDNISDSVITIIGISEHEGKNPEFENYNGQTGKRQISVTVTPHEEDIFAIRHNEFSN